MVTEAKWTALARHLLLLVSNKQCPLPSLSRFLVFDFPFFPFSTRWGEWNKILEDLPASVYDHVVRQLWRLLQMAERNGSNPHMQTCQPLSFDLVSSAKIVLARSIVFASQRSPDLQSLSSSWTINGRLLDSGWGAYCST